VLDPNARVFGNIHTPSLAIRDVAVFYGDSVVLAKSPGKSLSELTKFRPNLDLLKLVQPVPEAGPMLNKLRVTFWLQRWTVVGKFVYDDSPLFAVDHFVLAPNARKQQSTNKVARRFVALKCPDGTGDQTSRAPKLTEVTNAQDRKEP